MGQITQPRQSGDINIRVTTRAISWLDLAQRAWGAEFNAPDRGIYEFSLGRKFDSTDKTELGIYGGETVAEFMMDNSIPPPHYDAAGPVLLTESGVQILRSVGPLTYPEIVVDTSGNILLTESSSTISWDA